MITGINRFLALRELKVQGVRVPHYNRHADRVCFVNGLPLVFIELKAVYRNIRAGFDENLTKVIRSGDWVKVKPTQGIIEIERR